MNIPKEITEVLEGKTFVNSPAPSPDDMIKDVSTGMKTSRPMFADTDSGNRAYNEAVNAYLRECKVNAAHLGSILKTTINSLSADSISIMKSYGDYEKAKEDAGAFWKLIKDSHKATSDRETFNSLFRLVNIKQEGDNFLTYLALFNKAAHEFQDSVEDFDNLSATQLMDVLKKVLLMTGVDKDAFKQVTDNILDSPDKKEFIEVQRRLTQYYRNTLDRDISPVNANGYAAGKGKFQGKAATNIKSICKDCKELFPHQVNATTGRVFDRCITCNRRNHQERSADKRKTESPIKNLSLEEIAKIQEGRRKTDADAVEAKLKLNNGKKSTTVIPKKAGVSNTPIARKSTKFLPMDDELNNEFDNFGVESDEGSS
jgi:hypothetical protein